MNSAAPNGFFAEVVSHFARFDSLVEFGARSLPLGWRHSTTILSSTTRLLIQASNTGVRKIDGEWKILSVTWTIY